MSILYVPSFVAVPLFANFLKCLISFHSIKYYKFMKYAHMKNLSVISLVYLLLNIKNYESRYRPYGSSAEVKNSIA